MMRVDLIAYTVVEKRVLHELGYGWDADVSDADALAEFAGRSCYQSWSKPNPATADNKSYMGNILDHQHFSVLEHSSLTVYVEGVSRALTHELVRHRHFSYSQLSQRFVDSSTARPVFPPAIAADPSAMYLVEGSFARALGEYADLVDTLTKRGFDRKQVREAARAVLPNSTETKIVVTGNVRAWREFLSKRATPQADAEMQRFAARMSAIIRGLAPNSTQDMDRPTQ